MIEHRIDYNNPESLDNLFVKLNLECESHSAIGNIGSAFFVGVVIGCFFVPRLADLYGRKRFVIAGQMICLLVLLVFYIMEDIKTLIVC